MLCRRMPLRECAVVALTSRLKGGMQYEVVIPVNPIMTLFQKVFGGSAVLQTLISSSLPVKNWSDVPVLTNRWPSMMDWGTASRG